MVSFTWGGVDTATKELVPVVVAAALWGSRWAGKHILLSH